MQVKVTLSEAVVELLSARASSERRSLAAMGGLLIEAGLSGEESGMVIPSRGRVGRVDADAADSSVSSSPLSPVAEDDRPLWQRRLDANKKGA